MKITLNGAVLLTLVLLVSCGPSRRSRTDALFTEVGAYLDEHPDSALAVLRAIPPRSVRGREQRARAALLHSAALDKNHIDLQTDSILAPALIWYARHGSPDEQLRTLYYQGRIYQNAQDLENAAMAFAQAETLIPKAKDARMKGLLCLAQSVLYRQTYSVDREIESIMRGQEFFVAQGDTTNTKRYHARLAMAYHGRDAWQTADSEPFCLECPPEAERRAAARPAAPAFRLPAYTTAFSSRFTPRRSTRSCRRRKCRHSLIAGWGI